MNIAWFDRRKGEGEEHKKYTLVNILKLSDFEANCDIRHSPDHLRVICSLSGVGSKNEEPRNVILKHFELKEGTLIENTDKAIKLNLESYGV